MVLTRQCLVVGWRAHGLGRVGWWVLCRVGCCRQPWLGGHGVVALVRRPRVAGRHTWRLRVRGVHHGGGCGGGHDRCKENPRQDPRLALPPSLAESGSQSAPLAPLGSVHKGPMGMLTAWSAAHLVQTAAGAGEADDDGDNKEHKDGQANGHSRPKPAKEPGVTKAPPYPGPAGRSPPTPRGTPLAEGGRGTDTATSGV